MHTQAMRHLREIAESSENRMMLWTRVVQAFGCRHLCEIGVLRGEFAKAILSGAPLVETYYMVDPWRFLEGWNKPANRSDVEFEDIYREAMEETSAFTEKVVVLRDVSKKALKQIPDGALDFAYIDGDHTLRGIAIDLICLLPKIRLGGIIGGDDFTKNIWQHGTRFSPTEVFPFALYFAEAYDLKFVTLPFNQFCMWKDPQGGFELLDLAGYASLNPIDIYTPPSGPS